MAVRHYVGALAPRRAAQRRGERPAGRQCVTAVWAASSANDIWNDEQPKLHAPASRRGFARDGARSASASRRCRDGKARQYVPSPGACRRQLSWRGWPSSLGCSSRPVELRLTSGPASSSDMSSSCAARQSCRNLRLTWDSASSACRVRGCAPRWREHASRSEICRARRSGLGRPAEAARTLKPVGGRSDPIAARRHSGSRGADDEHSWRCSTLARVGPPVVG